MASTGVSPQQQPDPSLSPAIPIEAARADASGAPVPDRIADTEQVRDFVQDRTGGIMVLAFSDAGVAGATPIQQGDSVVVRGTVETLWLIALGAVAVLALASLWLFLLRRQVRGRTRELADSEARSRKSEQRLSLLLEHAPMGLWAVDRDLRFTWVEGGSLAGMAVAPDSVLGRTVQDVLATDDPTSPRLAAYYQALEGQPGHFDIEWGGRIWEVHLQPLREQGEITGVAGAAMDVTHHREMESRLEEQTTHFRTLFEDAPEAIVVLDEQDRVVEVNPEFERTFGYTPQEAVGQPINDLISMSGREDEASELTQRVARGERLNVETVRRRKDGTLVHVSILAKPIDVGGRRRVYGIYRDITEQKRLEAQLLHSQRLEAVGQLAGGIAHDFNNILTAILGHTRLLLEDVQDDDELREDLERIEAAGERAAHLTRQLLTFSRREMVERGPVHLNAVIRETRDLLHRLIEERVQVVFELADELPSVNADAGQLQQVVMNLVINARDAMPSGGQVTVSTHWIRGRTGAERDAGPGGGDQVELVVRDEGHGMTPEEKARMFEPFFTTKKSGQGTGLGLSTVYGIVEQTGGHIDVETAPGQGTTVSVRLPAKHGAADAPRATETGVAHQDAAAMRAGGEVILLVDDERAVREVTRRILERAGYHVIALESGQAALDYVDTDGVEADLLLADIVMPGMSGFELAEQLRQRNPGIQVLLMTGYAEAAADGSNVEEILSKPFDAGTLLHRLRQSLASR